MKRIAIIFGVVLIFIAPISFMYFYQQQHIDELEERNEALSAEIESLKATHDDTSDSELTQQGAYTSEKGVTIIVTTPASDSKVSSPLEVKGSVPGSWSHEGVFTVRLLDAGGAVLDEQPARIQGDWMTEDMAQFSATLIFTPSGSTGSLVLEKANPSGLSENNDSVTIPVQF